tara:strand:- start:6427 stop:7761 length:1335 start_codon:yes stop_codon:yes gene_type:complete
MNSKVIKDSKNSKILVFCYHYFPDHSAGAIRAKLLVEKLKQVNKDANITIFCSVPRRYGKKYSYKSSTPKVNRTINNENINIKRFWVPYLGSTIIATVVSYMFYFVQALFYSLFIKPDIIIATSAKLLTSFLATISAKITRAKLFIDIRDTFCDNYFYFYRWNKRILIISLIILIENFIIRSANSINIVSTGFTDAYHGWKEILRKNSTLLTNYPNGINNEFVKSMQKSSNRKNKTDDKYHVIYAGNLGEGQDLLSLITAIKKDKNTISKMLENQIKFDIYGAGSQLDSIKEMIEGDIIEKGENLLSKVIDYKGFIPRDNIKNVYETADCLMLQLGSYHSLSMVIPTKFIEYSTTVLPILYGAKGFTNDFISKIQGTIPFKQYDPNSFYNAIVKSKQTIVEIKARNSFIEKFDTDTIYDMYARHILGKESSPIQNWVEHINKKN